MSRSVWREVALLELLMFDDTDMLTYTSPEGSQKMHLEAYAGYTKVIIRVSVIKLRNCRPSTTRVAMIHAALDMVGADAQAFVLYVCLACILSLLQARYKKQFEKLVACISDRYMVSSLV